MLRKCLQNGKLKASAAAAAGGNQGNTMGDICMKREYKYTVNGFETTAVYEDDTVEQIFLPLLRKWSSLYQRLGRRVLIFLSAAPGVGKTTTAQFLEYLSKREPDIEEIQAIGLDGFHYHQDYILSHEVCVDGVMVPMKEVKGSPETYDIEKLRYKIKCLKEGNTKWPIYDRTLHDVCEEAVEVEKQIVLLEGNWLLLKEAPWDTMIRECDDSLFISAEETFLRERLIQRKMKGGLTAEEAEEFYKKSDGKNVRRIMGAHWQAGQTLRMQQDGTYVWMCP